MLNSCHDPHYDRHYPRFSPSNLGRVIFVVLRLRRILTSSDVSLIVLSLVGATGLAVTM
jgi:hypothetical protein